MSIVEHELMALDEAHGGALKCSVLHLLLQHSQGIKFGDFSGAYYKFYGHHPQLAIHGYRSLKSLLTDMKDMVVLEQKSLETVIKVVNGSPLRCWLDEGEGWSSCEEGLDSFNEEMQSLMDKEVEEAETLCLRKGPANKGPDGFRLIRSVVRKQPHGLKLKQLKRILNKKHGFNLGKFRISQGYCNIISLLEDIPGLLLQNCQRSKNCTIQLQSESPRPTCSLDCNFNTATRTLKAKKTVLAAAVVPILHILGGHPNGLELQMLKENLKKHGFDLENFSQDMASHSSAPSQASASLSCDSKCSASKSKTLNQNILGVKTGRAVKSVPPLPVVQPQVKPTRMVEPPNAALGRAVKSVPPLPVVQPQVKPTRTLEPQNAAPGPAVKSVPPLPVVRLQVKPTRTVVSQNAVPAQAEWLAMITDLLKDYTAGLRIKKLQEFLLTLKGFDLEKYSIARGYKDTLEFLEHQMPELKIAYQESREKCVVKKEEGRAVKSVPPLPVVQPQVKPTRTLEPQNAAPGPAVKSVPPLPVVRPQVKPTRTVVSQNAVPAQAELLAMITDLLKDYTAGLRIKKLQEFLLTLKGFDLEKYSIARGYKDTLEFLEHQMPELKIAYQESREKCVVKKEAGRAVKSVPPLPVVQPQVKPTRTLEPQNAAPAQAELLAMITDLLKDYTAGLRIKKLQEFLLTLKGFDLEKYSIARGYKDTLEFLEHQMPELKIAYQESRDKCVVKKEAGRAVKSVPPLPVVQPQVKPTRTVKPQNAAPVKSVPPLPVVQPQVKPARMLEPQNAAPDPAVKSVPPLPVVQPQVNPTRTVVSQNAAPGLVLKSVPPLPVVQPQVNPTRTVVSQNAAPGPAVKSVPPLPVVQLQVKPTRTVVSQNAAPVLAAASVPILHILGGHPNGLDLQTLTENLKKHGFDLENFSQDMGYGDTVDCLLDMPGLHLTFLYGMATPKYVVQLLSRSLGLPALPLNAGSPLHKPLTSRGSDILSQKLMETKPASHSSAPSQASFSCDLKCSASESKPLNQNVLGEKPGPAAKSVPPLPVVQPQMKPTSKPPNAAPGLMLKSVPPLPVVQPQVNPTRTVVSQNAAPGPAVESVPPLPDVQPQVEPTRTVKPQDALPDFGGISRPPFSFGDVSVHEILTLKRLHNNIPVPSTVIPNPPFSKEHQGASSGEAKNSSQAPSDIPAQQLSAGCFGGPLPARELSCPTDAPLLSKSSLTQPPHLEDLGELKQQVAHILAMHPEGMSLFQFRAAYSVTYQHHLPLGNASSAKQRLLEMSDIVCMKGYSAQTLLFPVSPGGPLTRHGLPVFPRLENAMSVPADSLSAASPELAVFPVPSLPKDLVESHSRSVCSLSSDHLRAPDIKEKCVLPEGQLPKEAKIVAPLQDHVRPKASIGGQPNLCKSEKAAMNPRYALLKPMVKVESLVASKSPRPKPPVEPQPCSVRPLYSDNFRTPDLKEVYVLPKEQLQRVPLEHPVRPKANLGGQPDLYKSEGAAMTPCYSLPKPVVKNDPVVFPKSSVKPSEAVAVPVPQLYPSVFSASACLRAPSNNESSFLPASQLPRPTQPVALAAENARARVPPGENLLIPHSLAEPQVTRLNQNWTLEALPSSPMFQANPSFYVNIPVPSLFQPVFSNFVAMAQPVVCPPDPRLPETPANPSLSSTSYQSVSRTQMQKRELVTPSLAHSAPQSRTAQLTSPIQRMEQNDQTRTTQGQDPLRRTSSTQAQNYSLAPHFSAKTHPVSLPSVNPTSHQPLKSQSAEPLECVHHKPLNGMQCSLVPTAGNTVIAAVPSRLQSKPVTPTCQEQYASANSLVTSPRTRSSGSSQAASSPFSPCTQSDTLVSKPQPRQTPVNAAMTSSSSQQPPVLPFPRGSPTSVANQSSCHSFRANTDYDASPQRKTVPGISNEGSERDSRNFTLPENQKYCLGKEPAKSYPLQNSPAPQNSDRCVIL